MDIGEKKNSRVEYVLTTNTGMIPYVIHEEDHPCFNKTKKLYLDDFVYNNSYYEKEPITEIKEYIKSTKNIIIDCIKSPSVLTSKKGNYYLDKEKFHRIIKIMNPEEFVDYKTRKLVYKGKEVYEPVSFEDFMNKVDEGVSMFGTGFINKLVSEGNILKYNDKEHKISLISIEDSENNYQKYLYSLNEINYYTYSTVESYMSFYNFFEWYNSTTLL